MAEVKPSFLFADRFKVLMCHLEEGNVDYAEMIIGQLRVDLRKLKAGDATRVSVTATVRQVERALRSRGTPYALRVLQIALGEKRLLAEKPVVPKGE